MIMIICDAKINIHFCFGNFRTASTLQKLKFFSIKTEIWNPYIIITMIMAFTFQNKIENIFKNLSNSQNGFTQIANSKDPTQIFWRKSQGVIEKRIFQFFMIYDQGKKQ